MTQTINDRADETRGTLTMGRHRAEDPDPTTGRPAGRSTSEHNRGHEPWRSTGHEPRHAAPEPQVHPLTHNSTEFTQR